MIIVMTSEIHQNEYYFKYISQISSAKSNLFIQTKLYIPIRVVELTYVSFMQRDISSKSFSVSKFNILIN